MLSRRLALGKAVATCSAMAGSARSMLSTKTHYAAAPKPAAYAAKVVDAFRDKAAETKVALIVEQFPEALDATSTFGKSHQSLLHLAASHHQYSLARSFALKNPSLLATPDSTGKTPFMVACAKGDLEMLKVLHAISPDLIYQWDSRKQQAAIHYAVKYNHAQAASWLAGLDPQLLALQDAAGNTPFHLACNNGHLQLVKDLLSLNTEPLKFENHRGYIPIECFFKTPAAPRGPHAPETLALASEICAAHPATARYLLPHSANIDVAAFENRKSIRRSIFRKNLFHAKHGQLPEIQASLPKNRPLALSDISMPDQPSNLLHMAVLENKIDIVAFFVSLNIPEINLSTTNNTYKSSAMHLAAAKGHTNILQVLHASAPGLVTLKDSLGRTPLHLAVQRNHLAATDRLLMYNSDLVLEKDAKRLSPIQYACANNAKDILALIFTSLPDLAKRPAALKVFANQGKLTPILLAIQNDHLDIVNYLLSHFPQYHAGQHIDAKTSLADAATHLATQSKSAPVKQVVTAFFSTHPPSDDL